MTEETDIEHFDPVAAELIHWVAIGILAAITLFVCAQLLTFGRPGMVAALVIAAFGSGLVLVVDRARPLRSKS